MDDLNAFERQLHNEVQRALVPAQPVDVSAIVDSATQSPKWRFHSMFSATKFVAAGVIVALFGGFLAAGIVTQPSEEAVPATTTSERGTFSPTGALAQPRAAHTATLLPDGRVLIVGGVGRSHVYEVGTKRAEVWDPDTDTFSPIGSLAEGRAGHTATLLPDGRVLVIGGRDIRGRSLNDAEVWDPATADFSRAGFLSEARAWHDATLLPDGRVLVVGGGDDEVLASAEVWDPATNRFSWAGEFPSEDDLGDFLTTTALADGRVLILGGDEEPSWAEVWDPDTGTSSPAGSPALARPGPVSLLADGRVIFLGDDPTSDEDMTSAEVWDPATGIFSPAGSFPGAGRYGLSVTALDDGGVLIAGGCSGEQSCSNSFVSAEVWDPDTQTFGPTGSLSTSRSEHTATALPDGRILVVGGWGERAVYDSAEVWEPDAR